MIRPIARNFHGILCQGVFQQCPGKVARCRLEEDQYISGQFPGGQTVLVETPPGDWRLKVLLFLDPDIQPRSPGARASSESASFSSSTANDRLRPMFAANT